ncbi:MAG: AIR synthase-related protein, partial [Defluviitoga tunisiensis]
WKIPKVFEDILNAGVDIKEMFHVFNMGIGMVYIVSKDNLKIVSDILNKEFSEEVQVIGEVLAAEKNNIDKKILIKI